MTTYIAFLRGINVSGHNKIKMIELKQLFIDIGFSEITTYIQSGNVVFKTTEKNTSKIAQSIINAIQQQFGYSIKVLILTKIALSQIYNSNPFIERNNEIDISKLCVTLLDNIPTPEGVNLLEGINTNTTDEFLVKDKTVYLNCPNGFGKTKLTNNLFERKLKVNATTRNWKTITKLIELSC